MLSTQIIRKSNSWKEFNEHLQGLSKKEKGDCFEALTKYYLRISPTYASKLQNVWDLREVPNDLKKHLNLPDNDEGIDLIAETKEGGFWAIQCKYRSDELKSLTRHHIDTFTSLTFINCKNFELALVCTTADRFSHKLRDFYGTGLSLCCGDVWRSLDQQFFQRLHGYLDDKIVRPDRHQPRSHQQTAIERAENHFLVDGNSRGKLIMPCGTGKSLTSYWMAQHLGAKTVLMAVPSLALIRQSLEVWTNESQAEGQDVNWLCVCSDPTVKDIGFDDPTVLTQDLGILVHTDSHKIAEWLKKTSDTTTLVITTYQSGKVISEACREVDFRFDLGIMDEAHKTTGKKDGLFSHLLFDENVKIKHRLFMTATERRYIGNSEKILSMEDPEIYGETFYLLSFKEALECQPPILSHYQVITIIVTTSDVAKHFEKNDYLDFFEGQNENPEEARTLATAIAFREAMLKYPIRHSLSFHSSVMRAERFMKINNSLNDTFPQFGFLKSLHVRGSFPTATRSNTLCEFAHSDRALVTNARCLTEGIDLPGIDCVVFADPKKSVIDVVQATGRVLRTSPQKKIGFIIVPVILDENDSMFVSPDDSRFGNLLFILRSLASNDERIVEYFRSASQGESSRPGLEPFEVVVPEGQNIDQLHFKQSIRLRLWPRLKMLAWRPFVDARDFARGLGLRNRNEWNEYCRARLSDNTKEFCDIPVCADQVYKNQGWMSWGDWLGTGTIAVFNRQYRPFEDAREFARSLCLRNKDEWAKYSNGELPDKPPKPEDIPANPPQTYKDKGWDGWGDWLGTGTIANQNKQFRPFKDAREFARSLGLKSGTFWRKYRNQGLSGKLPKPNDVPANPGETYKNQGWAGMGDWLGTGTISVLLREYRLFEDARAFARSLGLQSRTEWKKYCTGKFPDKPSKPEDIPVNPYGAYKGKGWVNWGDWLGTGTIATYNREYRSFGEARKFVHSLELKSLSEWMKYCAGKFPDRPPMPEDIPAAPGIVYKDQGWAGWGDWLGTGTIAVSKRVFRSFEDAREFARSLDLMSRTEWKKYCAGEFPEKPSKPDDIPVEPVRPYKDQGWAGWGDWLGTGTVANQNKQFRSFEDAKGFAGSLGLMSRTEWEKYCAGEFPEKPSKPDDIPVNVAQFYKDQGWAGWGDWLGTSTIVRSKREWRSFHDARAFSRSLGLKSRSEWKKYCSGGFSNKPPKPEDIPIEANEVYKDQGWAGWGDWLGTGTIAGFKRVFRSFEDAREFARSLGLKSKNEWARYCSGEFPERPVRPHDVPVDPSQVYKDKGWAGWKDWLGN